jgi:hypothetical protein
MGHENAEHLAIWEGAKFGLGMSGLGRDLPWKYLIPAMDRVRRLCNNQVAP